MCKAPKIVSRLSAVPIAVALIGLAAAPAAAHEYHHHHYYHHHYYDADGGAGIAAGIFGLMAGVMLDNALAPHYYSREYYYGPGYYYRPHIYRRWDRDQEEREEREGHR